MANTRIARDLDDRLADRVADVLSNHADGFMYANLAVRGKLIHQVVNDQVPRALEMIRPNTLVSFHAGANDVIRPNYKAEVTLPAYSKAVRDLAAQLEKFEAKLMLFTVQESAAANTRTGEIWNQRFRDFNEQVRELAKEVDAILNEANDGRYPNDIRFLAFDRLHLNPEGHNRVAQGVLENLGLPFDSGYKIPLPPAKKENPIKKKFVNVLCCFLAESYDNPTKSKLIRGTTVAIDLVSVGSEVIRVKYFSLAPYDNGTFITSLAVAPSFV